MTFRTFFIQLGLVTAGTIILLVLIHQSEAFRQYAALSWLSLGFFVILSVTMFYFASQSARNTDPNAFSRIVLGFIAGKMFLSVLLIVAYKQGFDPPTPHYVGLFIIIYLVYTIFETYFMMKVAKIK